MRYIIRTFLFVLTGGLTSAVAHAGNYNEFERLDGPPFLKAFIEYAAMVGVEEGDITSAIFSGTFVPHPNDIFAVKRELDTRSCEEIEKSWTGDGFDCNREKRRPGTLGDIEWNRRFGQPNEKQVFHMAQRAAYMLGISKGPWQKPGVDYEDVKNNPAVQSAMRSVRSWALPSYIQLRSMNDEYGPKDFGGVFEKNRKLFIAERSVDRSPPANVVTRTPDVEKTRDPIYGEGKVRRILAQMEGNPFVTTQGTNSTLSFSLNSHFYSAAVRRKENTSLNFDVCFFNSSLINKEEKTVYFRDDGCNDSIDLVYPNFIVSRENLIPTQEHILAFDMLTDRLLLIASSSRTYQPVKSVQEPGHLARFGVFLQNGKLLESIGELMRSTDLKSSKPDQWSIVFGSRDKYTNFSAFFENGYNNLCAISVFDNMKETFYADDNCDGSIDTIKKTVGICESTT
jgi:hypothetical protein